MHHFTLGILAFGILQRIEYNNIEYSILPVEFLYNFTPKAPL
jgi:hypothetical protein